MTSRARARFERWLTRGWSHRGFVYWAFLDLSWLYAWIARRRRDAWLSGRHTIERVGAPVVVVGNLVAGGTGKTPVVIALVAALRARGHRPGVVSRGYGARRADAPRAVDAAADPGTVGDEPILIATRAEVPVFVHPDRPAAARALLAAHPQIDVIVSDDGLQHYALARAVELVVFDARGAGNGRALPAGPLREALDRPRDATVFVGCPIDPALAPGGPAFAVPVVPRDPVPLDQGPRRLALDALRGMAVSAYAGIGHPEKFFDLLRALGAEVDAHPLSDHHAYDAHAFADARHATIVISEKDAVKCARLAALRADPRVWVLPIEAPLPQTLVDLVDRNLHGSQAA